MNLGPCPKDTDGDGDCGNALCEYCGDLVKLRRKDAGEKIMARRLENARNALMGCMGGNHVHFMGVPLDKFNYLELQKIIAHTIAGRRDNI